ncbi:MAG: hypothetical protein JWL86_198 [Rhizobium sp.]|nr:hypothetical protein [Rhizobium sp.]
MAEQLHAGARSMKTTDQEKVIETVEAVQAILAQYARAEARDAVETLDRLSTAMDDQAFINAFDRLKGRRTLRLVD